MRSEPQNILFYLRIDLLVALGACSSHHTPATETISATGGTPQSTAVSTPFGTVLVATVMTGTTADSGVSVTFTAPSSGASGNFGSGATTATVTTDSNGHATAPAFTANGTAGSYTVTASATGVSTPASFSLSNTAGAAASITATGGTPQSAAINSAFATALSATVEDADSNPVSGAVVTFTAPASGAGGLFTGGVSTITATTNSSGVASTTITANGILGLYTVTASVSGVSGVADFALTNIAGTAITGNFSFYATGIESDGGDTYSLAGAIQINSNGTITGEQDFNDGDGFTFPDDQITSGSLSLDSSTGLGTLTLNVPGDTNVGVNGVEVFSLSFVNSKHAVINEFDGGEASSGSLDTQTFGPLTSGGIAFSLTGAAGTESSVISLATGGVFSLASNGGMTNGFFDSNVDGNVVTAQPFSGQLNTTVDSFGRGSISVTADGFPVTLYYYVVNSECVRLIDMDTADSGVGSAISQGASTNTFTNISIGQSVIAFNSNSNPFDNVYSAVAQFTVGAEGPAIKRAGLRAHPEGVPVTNTFTGVGDVNEEGETALASSISGNYFMDLDGYGSLSITNGGLGDVATLGIYAVDPNININDPNNSSGGGGALVVDLDTELVGTGVLVPQTDIVAADFSGNYSFVGQVFAGPGGEDDFDGSQFDFVGSGTVTAGSGFNSLTGTGFFNDIFELIVGTQDSSNVTFDATMSPDTENPGRYVPYQFNFFDDTAFFDEVNYQASGALLFLFEVDDNGITVGQYQQQTSLTSDAKKPPLKASRKH